MNLYFLSIALSLVQGAFYHFAYNYGQVLKDLSGDLNHAINGETTSVDSTDTFPTDRGAYFSGTKYIKLPPNTEISTSISITAPFSYIAWVMSENNRGTIFLRMKDTSNYFFIMRTYWASTLTIRIKTSTSDTGDVDGTSGGFPNKVWKLVVVTFSGTQINGYVDKVLNLQRTLTSEYTESGNFEFFIGKESPVYSGFAGFIYYAAFKNEIVDLNSYIGSSSSNCFVSGCTSCTSSIIDPVLGITACASVQMTSTKDSKGTSCSSTCTTNKVGCDVNKMCLLCSCNVKTCFTSSGSPYCICSSSAVVTQTTCSCTEGYYSKSVDCLKCMEPCSSCTTGTSCSSCFAKNTELGSDGICRCKYGYYAENEYLNTTDACVECFNECETCSEAGICLTCKALNSSPDSEGGCKCDDKYYGTSLNESDSCKSCHSDCQTCNEGNKCVTCSDSNAIPDILQGCLCKDGYFKHNGTSLCTACHGDCGTCENESTCLTCKYSHSVPSSLAGCDCIDGFYFSNELSNCNSCHADCILCNSSNICLTCKVDNAVPSATGGCLCEDGLYLNISSNSCEACFSECSTCSEESRCLTCKDANSEIDLEGKCKCKKGFYLDLEEGLCKGCYDGCGSCDSKELCLECVDQNAEPKELAGCECKSGFYYESEEEKCKNCNSDCGSCSGENICLTCKDENATPWEESGCTCKDKYFLSPDSETCAQCHTDCATCNSSTICLTCIDSNKQPSTSSGCSCKNTYYLEESSNTCSQCHTDCLTCTNNETCLSCKQPNSIPGPNSGCICKVSYYLSNETNSCMECHHHCYTCDKQDVCLTCKDSNALPDVEVGCKCNEGFYFDEEYRCKCNEGFYYDEENENCKQCLDECKTCNGIDKCSSCKDENASVGEKGECLCNDGFYFESETNICISCFSDCATCSTGEACLSCKDFNAEPGETIGCKCKSKYYLPSDSTTCNPCHTNCATCSDSTTCLSCTDPNAEPSVTGCICISNYTINPATNLCSICHQDCKNCSENFECLSCIDENSVPNSNFSCDCKENYYKSGVSCLNCHNSCNTCSNSNSCLTCLDPNAEISPFLCQCKSGYFENSLGTCVQCSEKCLNCSSLEYCLSCKDENKEAVNGQCQCFEGFFEDNEGVCVECKELCKICLGSELCKNCSDENAEVVGGICECKDGFFYNGLICEPCSAECKTCSGIDFCLTCTYQNALVDSNGTCTCKELFFNNTNTCEACHEDCLTCQENQKCLTCKDSNSQVSDTAGCECKQTYFLSSGSCLSCLEDCLTCSDNKTCLSCKNLNQEPIEGVCKCKSKYFESLELCQPCHKDCKTCDEELKCLSCVDPNSEPDDSEGCICKVGYFFDGFECIECGKRCSKCQDVNVCLECGDEFSENLNGTCACVKGYYSDIRNICEKCSDDCESCSGKDGCDSCKDIYQEVDANGSCKCKIGFYYSGISCLQCPSDCKSCQSSSECLSCNDINGNPEKMCECVDGMYYDNERVCKNCSESCATCENFSFCTSCADPNSISVSGICNCKTSYFNDSDICSPCLPTCKSCDNPSTCLTCLDTNAILTSSGTCTCPASYILQDSSCLTCHSSCLTCSSPNTCLVCSDTNAEIALSGLCECKNSFFYSNLCLPCDKTCYSCSNALSCISCIDSQMSIGESGLCECEKNYYFDSVTQKCQKCFTGCEKCSSELICIECSDSHTYGDLCLPCHKNCLTCYKGSKFNCLTCDGYLLSGYCLKKCPLNFFNSKNKCILNPLILKIIQFKFEGNLNYFFDLINNFIANQFITKDLDNQNRALQDTQVTPIYQRGAYFPGTKMLSVDLSSIYLLSSNFSISIWLKTSKSSGFLLTKSTTDSDLLSISIKDQKIQIDLQINSQIHSYTSSSSIILGKWTSLILTVSYVDSTFVELFLDTEKNIYETVSEYPFMDADSEYLFIGGNSIDELYYQGYVYSLEIYPKEISVNDLVTECNECDLCPYEGTCISECEIGTVYEESTGKCVECPENCPLNCKDSETCEICQDSHCLYCTSYESKSCLTCESGYQVLNNTCEKCLDTEFFSTDTQKCLSCIAPCTSCISSSICTACIENSEISENGLCQCSKGFKFENYCKRVYFSASLYTSENNIVILNFTENLIETLKKSNLNVKIDSKTCEFNIAENTKSEYLITPDLNKIEKKGSILQINFEGEIVSEQYSLLETQDLQSFLYYTPELDEEIQDETEAQDAKSAAKFGSITGVSIVLALSLLTLDPLLFFDFLNTLEMLCSVYFFNIGLHPILSEFLTGMRVQLMLPNLYSYMINQNSGEQMPDKFKDFGYSSNLFLINAGVQLSILTIVVFILLCTTPLYFVQVIREKLRKVKKIFKFGFFFRFWLQTSFEMMVAATYGLSFSEFNGSLQQFDYILCVFVLILQGVLGCYFLYLIRQRSKLETKLEIDEFLMKFGTFFEDFKEEGVKNWLFYLLYVIKRVVLVILYHTSSSGTLQLSITLIFFLLVPLYIIITKSFTKKFLNLYHFLNELIICTYICVLIISSSSSLNTTKETANTCINLIITTWALNLACSLTVAIIKIYINLKYCIQRCSDKKLSKVFSVINGPVVLGKNEENLGVNTEITEIEIGSDQIRTMRTGDGTNRKNEMLNNMNEAVFRYEKKENVGIKEVEEEDKEEEEEVEVEEEGEGKKEVVERDKMEDTEEKDFEEKINGDGEQEEKFESGDLGKGCLEEGLEKHQDPGIVINEGEIFDFETEVIVKKATGDESLIQL